MRLVAHCAQGCLLYLFIYLPKSVFFHLKSEKILSDQKKKNGPYQLLQSKKIVMAARTALLEIRTLTEGQIIGKLTTLGLNLLAQ